jgi:hypothetical protein
VLSLVPPGLYSGGRGLLERFLTHLSLSDLVLFLLVALEHLIDLKKKFNESRYQDSKLHQGGYC